MWVFIAHLVKHYSTNAEAMESNPAPKIFLGGLNSQLFKLRLQLRWSHLHVTYNSHRNAPFSLFKRQNPLPFVPALLFPFRLQFVSKLTERAVFNQTHAHMCINDLYPSAQSAYRKHHSTETALLKIKNGLLLNMNKQHVTLLVLLDLSAAFDTVDH